MKEFFRKVHSDLISERILEKVDFEKKSRQRSGENFPGGKDFSQHCQGKQSLIRAGIQHKEQVGMCVQ